MPITVKHALVTVLMLGGLAAGSAVAAIAHPFPLFAYHADLGRLSLYSDEPFEQEAGRRVLADVERRLESSSIDDHRPYAVVVVNSRWREAVFFNLAMGAAGVNHYPISDTVFLRRSNISLDVVFGRSGRPATVPRTLAYFAAHEIAHSMSAGTLGVRRLWNLSLPQWIREGYADYVGLGGGVDIDLQWCRYRAGDPEFNYGTSGRYDRFQMLTAFMLEKEHWTVERLLTSGMSEADALARMSQWYAEHHK